MGICRFLYDNLITSTMLSCNTAHQAKGIVTAPYKEGQGSGGLICYGTYDHAEDLDYIVEIDSTSGGNEIGQAEYRWKDGTTWDASTQLTAIAETTLSHGVCIKFTTAAGNDCYLGDSWYFKGVSLFGIYNLVDQDINTKWKTTTGLTYYQILIDLGAMSSITAFGIAGHNLTSATTCVLLAYDSSAYATVINSTAAQYNSGPMIHYMSSQTTARFWMVEIQGATDLSYQISEIFLGRYWEPSGNFAVDSNIDLNIDSEISYSGDGVRKDIFKAKRKLFNLSFPYMPSTEKDNFETMLRIIGDSTTKNYKPVFFNMDSTDLSKTYFVKLNEGLRITQHKAQYSIELNLEELTT